MFALCEALGLCFDIPRVFMVDGFPYVRVRGRSEDHFLIPRLYHVHMLGFKALLMNSFFLSWLYYCRMIPFGP